LNLHPFRSYSPAPRRQGDYSASPRRHSDRARSPREDYPEGREDYKRRSQSPGYSGDNQIRSANGHAEYVLDKFVFRTLHIVSVVVIINSLHS